MLNLRYQHSPELLLRTDKHKHRDPIQSACSSRSIITATGLCRYFTPGHIVKLGNVTPD